MYINIGKDIIIKKEEIIGIFNIESILQTKEYMEIVETLKLTNRIKDISNGNPKSIILYKKENQLCGIVSNISSSSIEKKNK